VALLVLLSFEILDIATRFDHLNDLVDLLDQSLCTNVDAIVCILGLVRLCTVLYRLKKARKQKDV
jgi:hypothetical protein